MKRTTLIYALVVIIALMAIVAVAQGKRQGAPGPQPGPCAIKCQQVLGLSPDQVAAMTAIRTQLANDTAGLRADLQAKMKDIAAMWSVEVPNLAAIKQMAAEADQIRAAIRDKSIDARGATLGVLTPEQRATCIKQCQSGQCGCGVCGMGMGMCGMGGAGMCCPGPGMGMGPGMGKGPGPGMGQGPACGIAGPGRGPGAPCCPMQRK